MKTLLLALCISSSLPLSVFANDSIPRIQFKNEQSVLTFEALNDNLLHFDYAKLAVAPATDEFLPTSPSIAQKTFAGATTFKSSDTSFETADALVQVDLETLCFTIFDKKRDETLTKACPSQSEAGNLLKMDAMKIQNLYGLGEQFQTAGVANGDWSGKIRVPGNQFGNSMTEFGGGHTGNAQFPILYALGPNSLNYAFYLDTVYPYQWDFTVSPWKIKQTQVGSDPSFRGYFFLGEDLPTLRSAFMDLVGHAPVPPKKAFGLWISEFGYRNWPEIEGHIETLRQNHFPVDGFVLDLYWFGQYVEGSPTSAMGMLTWDEANFPNPAERIARFKEEDGVGLMTIEESYVSTGLHNYASMAERGFFVNKDSSGQPMVYDAWWGKGSGIDWSNPTAGAAWHNELRKKQLTDLGITFHWTDLGEPEAWDPHNAYANVGGLGHLEADSHNLYNFNWDESIAEGYRSNHETARHFIMSRSGTTGVQRFGAGMWSGDIGSNMRSLAGHFNVQMNMSLSGVDYFGADTGGFNRLAVEGDINEVYTRWLANSSLFDVPVRPHADDGSKKNYTAPDRIGDLKSNLANLRTRYELAPYYYSLAYQAYRTGQAVIPPLVYYFQNDQNVRQIADEKMIGPSLLAATTSTLGQQSRDVYLPAGDWIDYRTMKWIHSTGETLPAYSLNETGTLSIPLFARAGAIIPKAKVDDQTMNVLGQRVDGSVITDLTVRVFASSEKPTQFNVIEDDGVSESYQGGAFAETLVTQSENADSATVEIAATKGTYADAPTTRHHQVEWVGNGKTVSAVKLNGADLQKHKTAQKYEKSQSGWYVDALGVVHAKTANVAVTTDKKFEFIF